MTGVPGTRSSALVQDSLLLVPDGLCRVASSLFCKAVSRARFTTSSSLRRATSAPTAVPLPAPPPRLLLLPLLPRWPPHRSQPRPVSMFITVGPMKKLACGALQWTEQWTQLSLDRAPLPPRQHPCSCDNSGGALHATPHPMHRNPSHALESV